MKKTLIAIAVGHALAMTATANENTAYHVNLDALEAVVTNPFSQQMGTQKLTADDIARRPKNNGNITDLLKDNPAVNFSNTAETSLNAGSISPNEVSFHGEKFYNNNFILAGMSNNDNIDPASTRETNGQNPWDLPAGNTQSFWVDTSLLKNLEAFDSNISAKYGQFTGGVVNADLIDPDSTTQSGKISYRTTRDSWTKFHYSQADQEAIDNNRNIDSKKPHKEFTKHEYNFVFNQPINDKSALLFAYNLKQSDILAPYDILRDVSEITANPNNTYHTHQNQKNETLMLRGIYKADSGDVWRATAMYSPHKLNYVNGNILNGIFTNTGGGYIGNIEWDKQLSWAKVSSYLGYKSTGNEVAHAEDDYHVYRITDSITWRNNTSNNANTTAAKGGYGVSETQKDILTAKQNFTVPSFYTGGIKHDMIFGWQADHSTAKYQRDKATNLYNSYNRSNRVICHGDVACIDQEQYAVSRTIYNAKNIKVSDSNYSMYLEDHMNLKNFDVSLGVRVDHNKLLGNTEIAPRLSATYDVFGDKRTRIFGGANRYYGTSVLAMALKQGIGANITQTRGLNADDTLTPWQNRTNAGRDTSAGVGGSVDYNLSSLKTPYSDELNIGVSQNLLGSLWTLKWVNRDSKRGFSYERGELINGIRQVSLGNKLTSKNDTISLDVRPLAPISFKYMDLSYGLGIGYHKTKTNGSSYNTRLDEDRYGETSRAYYDGKIMYYDELPSDDFNAKLTGVFSLNAHFPTLNLDWNNQFIYNQGKKAFGTGTSAKFTCPSADSRCGSYTGGDVYEYTINEVGSSVRWDSGITYKPSFGKHSFGLSADVRNVLDRVTPTPRSSTSSSYDIGRSFWLGATYNW